MYSYQSTFHDRSLQETGHYGMLVSVTNDAHPLYSIAPYLPLYHKVRMRYFGLPNPIDAKLTPNKAIKCFDRVHCVKYLGNYYQLWNYNDIDSAILYQVLWYYRDSIRTMFKSLRHKCNIGYYEPFFDSIWCISDSDDGLIGRIVKNICHTTNHPIDIVDKQPSGDLIDAIVSHIPKTDI